MEQAENGDAPTDTPVRVAVVGSGPAGVYTCEALLAWADEHGRDIVVDLVDSLPVPYGLLRHGVAPDHPRIKGIARVLRGITDDPRIRFLGNVRFGHDLTLDDVRRHHHAVVLCTGALDDRALGVPGEDLAGSHGAARFVTWYDGHPDAEPEWALDSERVAVVGVGNVALDVARMLVRPHEELDATDIPEHVREGFGRNRTRVVSVIGRRGPAHARFTPLELRELDGVGRVRVVVDPRDLELTAAEQEVRAADRHVDKVCTQLETWASAMAERGESDPDAAEAAALDDGLRVVRFRFRRAPLEVLGEQGRVCGLRLAVTATDDDGRVRPTEEVEELRVGAVYRAVGYRSAEVPGIPYDERSATIPNDGGAVLTAPGGEPVPGVYTAGWVKRGPSGVIGTNRSCAVETVGRLTAALDAGELADPAEPDPDAVPRELRERGVEVVDTAAWKAIDDAEIALGGGAGRERTKLADREAMLAVVRALETVAAAD